ncbi:serine/threonine protein kinase [Chondromyces apiculatus]|uniref:Putative serine/threonine-protein kinase pknH n=1 Tax=Chondromyces apiculatus DSM 436 TaxID=1192034 RepID=A0A017T7H7_9BACT|nr:serine/threonine-protein kinase [Chondromyces apiculatus]EYF05184.1 putative serine/threonine-protein kinase pknH [Chondromyces apiculatus DSM 436]
MSTVSLVEGSVFAERYRVLGCIASGGMGAVYEVTHLETNRRRALKVMHPQFLQSDELRERFRQEARVAADIESEFIVDVFDAGIDAATQMPFLVMELLRGEELGRLLRQRGHFTSAEVVTYLYQAALALDKTHRAMIVHRDLKPENLFLTHREDGAPRVKVLDFGIAKVIAESGTHVNATRSIGTPLYMAPEQFRPGNAVSPATDLYALAMVAYTLLVGRAYWSDEAKESGGNVFAFASAVLNGPQEQATERARRAGVPLPPAFSAWFARAAAFAPADRFPSASALVADLADALGVPRPGLESSGPQSLSRMPSQAELSAQPAISTVALSGTKTPERHRGRREVLGIGVGAALVVAALGGTGAVLFTRGRSAPEPDGLAAAALVPASEPAGNGPEAPPENAAPTAPEVRPSEPAKEAEGTARTSPDKTSQDSPGTPPAETSVVPPTPLPAHAASGAPAPEAVKKTVPPSQSPRPAAAPSKGKGRLYIRD